MVYNWSLISPQQVSCRFLVFRFDKEANISMTSIPSERASISVLLLGGFLIVFMGSLIYGLVLEHQQIFVLLLILTGLFILGLAGYLMSGRALPSGIISLSNKIIQYFGISSEQLLMLLLAPVFALIAALAAGDEWLARNFLVSLFAWLLAVAAVIAGGYKAGSRFPFSIDRSDLFVSVSLFALAFFLRIIAIGSIPTTLSGDEGSAGLMALNFLKGDFNNPFTIGWFSFPSLYFAVQSLGILIFGQTIVGLRFMSIFAGSLTVVALYWLARTLFNRATAVLAAIFLAALHFHIHFSRIGLNNIWDGLFAVITLAAFTHGWATGRRTSYIIGGLALGFGQYFYVTFRIFPLLILVWAGLTFLFNRQKFFRRLPGLLISALVVFVVVLPLLYFFARHPNEFYAPLQRVTIFNGWLEQQIFLENRSALAVIWGQITKAALGFTSEPLRLLYNPGSPLLLTTASGLFLLGLIWLLAHLNLRNVLLILSLLALVITGGLSVDAPASQRFIIAAPIAAIFVALPIAAVANWLGKNWPAQRWLVMIAAIILIIGIAANDLRYYFFEVYDSYVLGGVNTEVATQLAYYLDEQETSPDVYFFGAPRMGYYSFATLPYLVPEINAQDIERPLESEPDWQLSGPTVFIFLPERESELAHVASAYPQGNKIEMEQANGNPLFIVYSVDIR